jgi:hypothetical protein
MKKDPQNYLETLISTKLLAFLRHLELGDDHLKHYLTKKEYEEVLSLETLDEKTAAQIDADKTELAGNVTLIMNSFFTATVGLWLGLSGFLGKTTHSPFSLAVVLIFATVGGALIGLQNYKFTRGRGKTSVRKTKLQALQMDILNRVINERTKEINEKTDELNESLQKLRIKKTDEKFTINFDDQKELLKWVEKLDSVLENTALSYKDNQMYKVFAKEIDETHRELKNSLKEQELREEKAFLPCFNKLIRHEGEEKIPRPSWLQANITNLAISFIPTLFGSFGSTFVYFSGAPRFAEEFENPHLSQALTDPKLKKIELITSMLITLYFVITFLYLNYKAFIRNRKYDENEENLIKKKNHLRKLDDRLLRIKEAHNHMVRLATIFDDLKQLTNLKH